MTETDEQPGQPEQYVRGWVEPLWAWGCAECKDDAAFGAEQTPHAARAALIAHDVSRHGGRGISA